MRRPPFLPLRSRAERALVLFTLLLWGAPSPAADSQVSPSVRIAALTYEEVLPGTYATVSFAVENESGERLDAELSLIPPPGWPAVTTSRNVALGPWGSATVPFTLWVPPQASADAPTELTLSVAAAGGPVLSRLAEAIAVRPVQEVVLTALSPTIEAGPGERIRHAFRITNTGNVSTTIFLEADSSPDWPVDGPESPITLDPGGSREDVVGLMVSSSAPPGAFHLLTVRARSATPSSPAGGPVLATAQFSTLVAERASGAPGRHLPLRATFSTSGREGESAAYGFRAASEGPVSETTRMEFDLDLVSGNRTSEGEDWRSQYARVGVSRDSWGAFVGDVYGDFPAVAYGVLAGRGFSFRSDGEDWKSRVFVAKDRAIGAESADALGVDRRVAGGLWMGVDLIRRDLPLTSSAPKARRDIGVLSCRYLPGRSVKLGVETAYGTKSSDDGDASGRAARIEVEIERQDLKALARAYGGSDSYPGRHRNQDGLSALVRYRLARPLVFWGNVESARGRSTENHDSPEVLSSQYRIGAELEPAWGPRLELSSGAELDRAGENWDLQDTEERYLSATGWWPVRGTMLGAWTRWGRSYNHLDGGEGNLLGYGASVAGSLLGIRGVVRWDRSDDWIPHSGSQLVRSSVVGDFGWTLLSGKASLGLGVMRESNRDETGWHAGANRQVYRPRADLLLSEHFAFRTEMDLWRGDGEETVRRWWVSLTWNERQALPVPWSPEGGEVSGTVFLDTNGNGTRDSGEEGIAGVSLTLDGETRVTGSDGRTSWEARPPGPYTLDLREASLPEGLLTRSAFPQEVSVHPGEGTCVSVPVSEGCSVSGSVFHDRDRDSRRDEDEAGVKGVRVLLVGDGDSSRDCLTDRGGSFSFRRIPAGEYRVQVCEEWLPPEYERGHPIDRSVRLEPGEEIEIAPFGVGPPEKPIIKTFGGGEQPAAKTKGDDR